MPSLRALGGSLVLLVATACSDESPNSPTESAGTGNRSGNGGGSGAGSSQTSGAGGVGTGNGSGNGGTSSGTGGPAASGGNATGGDSSSGGASVSGGGGGGGGGGGQAGGPCQESACGSHKWACWKMPTPVTSAEATPNPQTYTDLGNGAVRDDVTCLVWEQANPGQQGTWQDSFDRCAELSARNYAGFDDWRLPTRIEMASITDVTLGSTGYPSIFEVTSGYYVTGSFWYKTILTDGDDTAGNETDMVWGYGTNGFTSNAIVRSNDNNVARCVRGNGAGEAAGEYAVEPANHYTVADGQVTDNYTGLVWQQGRSPSLLPWADAETYCAQLELGGADSWRVPTLNELATTVNEAKVGGAVVDSAFPNNPVGCKSPEYWFWAREASKVGGTAWGLSYCDGFTGWNAGQSGAWNYFPTANVRCVR